ncbi:uncharacterized protein LOC142321308 [Lycorma delicatula]|uniref:uncharacterized protein LOC142321308 n=1 Tax=Lycorma delicatula TaxID=130591 RepID=UPI003F50D8B9
MFLKQVPEIKKSNGIGSDMCFHKKLFENDDLSNVDIISRFCSSICTRELSIRAQALDSTERSIGQWIEGYGSPVNQVSNGNITNGSNSKTDYTSLLTIHIPVLLRLSVSCPFSDVRDRCKHILQLINGRCGLTVPFHKVKIGPSHFIPAEDLPSVGSSDEQVTSFK